MWLACPASVTLTKDIPRPSSKFAREGTAAHSVAEMILNGDVFLPDRVKVENEEFIVSPGMCRALNPYVAHVQSLTSPEAVVFLEKRVQVSHTHGLVWGTLDCGVQTMFGDLHVVDLKFGKGHFVEADTPQLKLYALGLEGLVDDVNYNTNVTLTICQPRVGSEAVRSYSTTLKELRDWRDKYVRPAIIKIRKGDTTEHAGSHCRWCVRSNECAAFAFKHQTNAASVFDDQP